MCEEVEAKQEMDDNMVISPERVEEAKLKSRYPNLATYPNLGTYPNLATKPAGSDLLRKRLQKGPKYFDSGDYNMAKAKMKSKQLLPSMLPPSAAEKTPEVTGDHIPTPQDLPQRKPSIVASKLATMEG